MSDPILLSGFSNTKLKDFRYHIDPESHLNNYIELDIFNKFGLNRKLRFENVSNLKIEEGFSGDLSGMVILDISRRQWDSAKIEVYNFEQDAGITFLANNLDVLLDELDT